MSSLHETIISDPAHIFDRLATFYGKIFEYRRLDRFTDVTIVCQEGCKFRCHRVALSAASEYFETMFSTNFREGQNSQDVYLQNIDGSTFEKILEYVYSGKVVPIDDDNVYSLLFASDFFIIPDIEKHCTHYLAEKHIPMDHALSIYLLASRLEKKTIKSVTGQFILEHLVHFCHDREFLRVPFRDLSSILRHFETSTESKEKALLNVIFRWVSNLEDTDDNNIESRFTELTQQARFEFMSQSAIEAFFNSKQDASRSNLRGDAGISTDPEDLDFIVGKKEVSIRAFFHSKLKGKRRKIHVYSLRETDGQAEWYVSSRPKVAISELRVAEMNGLLYSLIWSGKEWSFSSSTKIDLRTNQMSLALPSPLHTAPGVYSVGEDTDDYLHHSSLSMCTFRRHMYLFGLDEGNIPFQSYNAELDTWSVIQNVTSNLKPIRMESDNDRIYMIMQEKNNGFGSLVFRAYDPRVGRLDALNFPAIISRAEGVVECCRHQNKIYVSHIERDTSSNDKMCKFHLSSYDSLSDRWNVLNMGSRNLWYDMPLHWLVSDDRKLCMFGYSARAEGYYHVLSYDSFVQKWDCTECSAWHIQRRARNFIHAVAL